MLGRRWAGPLYFRRSNGCGKAPHPEQEVRQKFDLNHKGYGFDELHGYQRRRVYAYAHSVKKEREEEEDEEDEDRSHFL